MVGVLTAVLPRRHWNRLEAKWGAPPRPMLSGLATAAIGLVVGFEAFLRHLAGAAGAATTVTIAAAGAQLRHPGAPEITSALPQTLTLVSAATFVATPAGLLTVYSVSSGLLRAVAAYLDDGFGDPALTLADTVWRRGLERARRWRVSVSTRRRFGRVVDDRVVDGAALALSHVDVAVLAARPKPGWTPGTMVLSGAGCFRIVGVTECAHGGRTWLAYLLCRKTDAEILRRSVTYDLARADRRPPGS